MTTTEPPAAKKAKLGAKTPSTDASEAITFHLVRAEGGQLVIDEDGQFNPEMTHQLFGEEEAITGYVDPSVDLFFSPRFQALLDVKFASKQSGAADLAEPFERSFPAGLFQDKPAWEAAVKQEAPLDASRLGAPLARAETEEGTSFVVHHSRLAEADPQVKELHARAEPLLLFFVDGASLIDGEDPGWEVLLAVEQAPDGLPQLVGFATVYSFWAYPDRQRLRLSQVLVLPPHQGRGVGTLLLKALYAAAEAADAVDVTVEDGTEQLQRMRDRLDVQRALATPWLAEAAASSLEAATKGKAPSADGLGALALPSELAQRAQRELRLSRLQARRVWEGLLFVLAARRGRLQAEAVGAAVRARIEGQVASAKRGAEGKSVREQEGVGFLMCRGLGPAGPLPAAPVEAASEAEQAEALEGAVVAALQELAALAHALDGDAA